MSIAEHTSSTVKAMTTSTQGRQSIEPCCTIDGSGCQNTRSTMMMAFSLMSALYVLSSLFAMSQFHQASFIPDAPIKDGSTSLEKKKKDRRTSFALMTEPRCLNATPFVLVNAVEMLPRNVKVVLLHGHTNEECVSQWLREIPVLTAAVDSGRLVRGINSHMDGTPTISHIPHHSNHWLNVMYKNATFWESLYRYGDTVLTIQSDTLICSKEAPNWNHDYIGGITGRVKNPTNETTLLKLNGGLSIRSLDWVIKCLAGSDTTSKLAEDAVFNTCNRSNVTEAEALAFASDNGYTMCFDHGTRRVCPWGVHKPWTLGVSRGPPIRELIAYCPDIQKLSDLWGKKENLTGPYCMGSWCV